MNSGDFRKELTKIMPGYNWTVHRSDDGRYLRATGIQTAGFNRLSTLQVIRREREFGAEYEAKSSGFGKRSPWVSDYTAPTLAQALRGLQSHYESMASLYSGCASYLQHARKSRIKLTTLSPSTGPSERAASGEDQ